MSLPSRLVRQLMTRRRGSVLILVVALLLLMAIIGTAFISGARTDRYSAVQHNTNTQIDLLVQGVEHAVEGQVVGGLYSTTTTPAVAASLTTAFRSPSQEMSVPVAATDGSGGGLTYPYYNFDGPGTVTRYETVLTGGAATTAAIPEAIDLFLASRVPVVPDVVAPGVTFPVAWRSVSWLPFPSTSNNYIFNSPFTTDSAGDTTTFLATNRAVVQSYVTYKTEAGQPYPGLLFFIPQGSTVYDVNNLPTVLASNTYVLPNGTNTTIAPTAANINSYVTFAGDADGDGIADSPLVQLPVGQIDGVTYFAGVRVVDNNSAVNASTAYKLVADELNGVQSASIQGTATGLGYGFFRANAGLIDLLNPTAANPSSTNEIDALNQYRINMTEAAATNSTAAPSLVLTNAYDDTPTIRTDFQFFSPGDFFENQLARRGLNPGYNTAAQKFAFLGNSETAAMAYRNVLLNESANKSVLETVLPNETYTFSTAKSRAYSAFQVSGALGDWYNDQYNINTNVSSYPTAAYPQPVNMRPLLVGSNGQSNAAPSRFGNSNSIPNYDATTTYQFGDMVKGSDGYCYTSLMTDNNTTKLEAGLALPITPATGTSVLNNNPSVNIGNDTLSPPVYENPFWGRVPWTTTPIKTSANTGTFEQLYLAYASMMTDSVTPVNGNAPISPPQWQPPMISAAQPAQMFRSVIRDNRAVVNGGYNLSPMQMLQLRAALAAVNTMSLRDSSDDVISRHIVLTNQTIGSPLFDAEVYSTKKQPYISEVLADVQSATDFTKNYLAIELVNPYPTPIVISTSWKFAYINRTVATGGAVLTAPALTLTNIGPITPTSGTDLVIPPAQSNKPGRAYILGTAINAPMGFEAAITANAVVTIRQTGGTNITGVNVARVTNLEQALGNELVILKPRLADTPIRDSLATKELSKSSDPYDGYDETSNIADLVPVDQIDFSGTNNTGAGTNAVPYRLHYRRGDDPTRGYAWNFVYPGPYYPTANGVVGGTTYAYRQAFEHEPEVSSTLGFFTQPKSGVPQIAATPAPTFFTAPIQLANTFTAGVNPTFSEIPTPSGGALGTDFTYMPTTVNQFPYGGFARNGDLLSVPFIGAYRIRSYANPGTVSPSAIVTELNSVPMDAAYAFDTTLAASMPNVITSEAEQTPQGVTAALPAGNAATTYVSALGSTGYEQIGRFCPVGDSGADAASTNPITQVTQPLVTAVQTLDYVDLNTTNSATSNWHYHWAKKLFDYLTVQAPADDYFPNVDPRPNVSGTDGASLNHVPTELAPYTPFQNTLADQPKAVANRKASVANSIVAASEDTVPVEGLININTAPFAVLATLPFVPRGQDHLAFTAPNSFNSVGAAGLSVGAANGVDDNVDIAQAIVAYRNVFGPFRSIYDLYRVPAFALMNQYMIQSGPVTEVVARSGYFIANRPDPTQGGNPTWSSATTLGSDSPNFDFAEKYLLLNRVSNLITTRSDSFTCYILVQGWRNVGSSNPVLVAQRRAAFILDRSSATPNNPAYTTFPISQN